MGVEGPVMGTVLAADCRSKVLPGGLFKVCGVAGWLFVQGLRYKFQTPHRPCTTAQRG